MPGYGPAGIGPPAGDGTVAVAECPPKVSRTLSAPGPRRRVAVRHTSGDRIVAIVEVISPSNTDQESHVLSFVQKVLAALRGGVHVTLLDLLPPTPAAPTGPAGAVWDA